MCHLDIVETFNLWYRTECKLLEFLQTALLNFFRHHIKASNMKLKHNENFIRNDQIEIKMNGNLPNFRKIYSPLFYYITKLTIVLMRGEGGFYTA